MYKMNENYNLYFKFLILILVNLYKYSIIKYV